MAQRKKSAKKQEEILLDITEVTGQAEDFFERYQKQILAVVAVLALGVGGWAGYSNLYVKPKQKEALEQMTQAEWQFQRDSFNLALANPGGGYPGFADIVKNYGGTDAANAALYYAGICCLNMGQFDAAISYLDDFSAAGNTMPVMKNGALGDAWSEKGELDKALSFYRKAADAAEGNEILQPYYLKKVALLSTQQGKQDDAREAWETIRDEYPTAPEVKDAEKYLAEMR